MWVCCGMNNVIVSVRIEDNRKSEDDRDVGDQHNDVFSRPQGQELVG